MWLGTHNRSYSQGALVPRWPDPLPDGTQGVAYGPGGAGYQLVLTGGTPPYTFWIINGVLPAGLTLSSGGLISGTPSGSASFVGLDFGYKDSSP